MKIFFNKPYCSKVEIDNIITNVQLSEDDKELKIREIITGVLQ